MMFSPTNKTLATNFRNSKLLLLAASILVSLVTADTSTPPDSCIKLASDIVNGRDEADFPLTTDFSAYDQLKGEHVLTEFRVCYTDSRIIGMQTTYGVWPEGDAAEAEVSDEQVKMPMHGTVYEPGSEGDPSITCEALAFQKGQYVRGLIFYSSASTITQISVARFTPGGPTEMPVFGKKKGANRSPFLNFSTSTKNVFYGLVTQSVEEDVLTIASLGFISIDIECSSQYKEKLRLEEEARLEQERLK